MHLILCYFKCTWLHSHDWSFIHLFLFFPSVTFDTTDWLVSRETQVDRAIVQPLKTSSIMHDQTRHGQTENLTSTPGFVLPWCQRTGHPWDWTPACLSSRDTAGHRKKKRGSRKREKDKTNKQTYRLFFLQFFIKGTVSKGLTGRIFMTAPNPKGCSKGKKKLP